MAKENEKRTARILYVEQGKSGKELAGLLNVAEKTISNWVSKGHWKKARAIHVTSHENRLENLQVIVHQLADERIALQKRLKEKLTDEQKQEIREQLAVMDKSLSEKIKDIEKTKKDGSISLGTYLSVMKSIFDALQRFNPELYLKTIDFQEFHINEQSSILD